MRMACVIALSCLAGPACAQTFRLSDQEQALCGPDVIRFCLFKHGEPEALRSCLRDNRERLSALCLGLLKSRGN